MILVLGIVLLLIFLYKIIIKRDFVSPTVFWCATWMISSIFVGIDPFGIRTISQKAVEIVWIGVFSFIFGDIIGKKIRIKKRNKTNRIFRWKSNSYNKIMCYTLLIVSGTFSLLMLTSTLAMMRQGLSYAYVRDVLFGYGNTGYSFFSSSFMSTFYSWVVAPSVSSLLIVFILNLIKKQLPTWFNVLALIVIGIYTIANSGRSIIFHTIVFLYFVFFYFKISIPRKHRKKIIAASILMIGLLYLMTFYRAKNSTQIPSVYSYFSIDFPLLSYWVDYIDGLRIRVYGNGFFRGGLEGLNYLLGKVGLSTPLYWDMQEVFTLIQNKWIMVFNQNWYNAYVTCFFSFYFDFGMVGVALGSMAFGVFSRIIYKHIIKDKSILSIMLYMITVETIVDSTVRWQFGTFSRVIVVFLIYFSTQNLRTHIKKVRLYE